MKLTVNIPDAYNKYSVYKIHDKVEIWPEQFTLTYTCIMYRSWTFCDDVESLSLVILVLYSVFSSSSYINSDSLAICLSTNTTLGHVP